MANGRQVLSDDAPQRMRALEQRCAELEGALETTCRALEEKEHALQLVITSLPKLVSFLDTEDIGGSDLKQILGDETYLLVHEAAQRQLTALRESEARLRRALLYAPFPVMLFSEEGDIRLISKVWLELTGYDEGTLPTVRDWLTTAYEGDTEEMISRLGRLIDEEPKFRTGEVVMRCKDGSRRHWTCGISALGRLPDGKRLYVCMANDISAFRRAEADLREADQRKDQFLAMLAHELRNPLASIMSGLELLRHSDRHDPEEIRSLMYSEAAHLRRILDDLLDVSRITGGKIKLQLERLSLDEVLRGALRALDDLLRTAQHRVTVEVPDNIEVIGDCTRLLQVFVNLLSNSAKYTDPGGTIRITGSVEGRQIVIGIHDNGIGLSPENLRHIFEPFNQVDTGLARTRGGVGLGLTLVRELVQLHDGTVDVRSDGLGAGSSFLVTLPLADPSVTDRSSPEKRRSASKSDKKETSILLVEDNDAVARMTAAVLRDRGYAVEIAPDAASAIAFVRLRRPAVILSDIGLPDMNGYELAQALRANQGLSDTTLISISGYGRPEDHRQSSDAGYRRHLVKPLDYDALDALLVELAAERSLPR
ncbi:MAG: response regulator [Bdellovibrionales bacterium]|nr:response regulator [Bdellovibrionales bacterium]